jgi:CHAT domain-containing protein
VADESTAVLMKSFYSRLAGAGGRDQALRAAQMSLIRTPSRAHPFHWAGFQLSGDWK